MHEKSISCDDNILLENFTFLPGGLLFRTNEKSNLLSPSASLFHDALGIEDQIFPNHQYHSIVTSHNSDAGVLSTLCLGQKENRLDITTPPEAIDNMVGTFPSIKAKEATDEPLLSPKIIGVRLQGHLSGWTTPKGN